MPPKHKAGGCGCCGTCHPGCEWHTDDFSTDTSGDYTQVSGTWNWAGSALTTSSANAILVYDTANPHGVSGFIASINVNSSAEIGDQAKIIVAYEDSTHYLEGRITFGEECSTIGIYEDGTLLGERSVSIPVADDPGETNRSYKLELCFHEDDPTYDPGVGIARFTVTDTTGGTVVTIYESIETYAQNSTGLKAGIGTGTNAGTLEFDDFSIATTELADGDCLITLSTWDQRSGSWMFSTGGGGEQGAATTDSNALAINDATHPDGLAEHYLESDVTMPGGENDSIKFILGYNDDNNYAVVEATGITGGGTLSVYTRIAGVNGTAETKTGIAGLVPSASFKMVACLCPDTHLYGEVTIDEVETSAITVSSADGTKVGVATGTVTSGTADFSNIEWHKHQSQTNPLCRRCEDVACPQCAAQCQYFEDFFSGDSLGCDWSTESGSASVVSNAMHITTTGTFILNNTTQPENEPEKKIHGTYQITSVGDMPRIYFGYQGANDYYFAEYDTNSPRTLYIKQVVGGGAPSTLKSVAGTGSATTGVDKDFYMSYCNGYLSAGTDGVFCAVSDTLGTGESKFGLGTGTVVSAVDWSYVEALVSYWANGERCEGCGAGGGSGCGGNTCEMPMVRKTVITRSIGSSCTGTYFLPYLDNGGIGGHRWLLNAGAPCSNIYVQRQNDGCIASWNAGIDGLLIVTGYTSQQPRCDDDSWGTLVYNDGTEDFTFQVSDP